jgi:hypothetical protein
MVSAEMKLSMKSSQEETFQTLTDFIVGKTSKILISNRPSLIIAKIGGSKKVPNGVVEASISQTNKGSSINFNFNFTKEYVITIGALIGSGLIVVLLIGVIEWVTSFLGLWNIVSYLGLFGKLLLILIFGLSWIGIIRLTIKGNSEAKKTFISEFDLFAKSVQNKNAETLPRGQIKVLEQNQER